MADLSVTEIKNEIEDGVKCFINDMVNENNINTILVLQGQVRALVSLQTRIAQLENPEAATPAVPTTGLKVIPKDEKN